MTDKELALAAALFEATRAAVEASRRYQEAHQAKVVAERAINEAERVRQEALDALNRWRPEEP
jgi:fructose-specific phosphotransferase system component IIB